MSISRSARWLAPALLLAACGSSGSKVNTDIKITLTATPMMVGNLGDTSQISVNITNKGVPAVGVVALSATAGLLDNATGVRNKTLAAGAAGAVFTCPHSDSRCLGPIQLEADFQGVAETLVVTVTQGVPQDAGFLDSAFQDAALIDAEIDARPTDAGMQMLTLSSSKNPIFANVGDTADITATLKNPLNGMPRGGETIDFSVAQGGLTTLAGGTPMPTLSVVTDVNGLAKVRYTPGATGTSTIAASHAPSGTQATLDLVVTNVEQISWQSTKCGGASCTIMGIKGSGFNEVAQVTFKVVDAFNNPALGVKVVFSVTNPPGGTTVATMGTTDSAGLVTTNVASGLQIGVFTVKAVVIAGTVETFSPTIGIRGAKAANEGFQLNCGPVNNAAYVSPTPPRIMSIACTVVLVDRYNNPVGTGTSVNFKTEAGSVPNAIATTVYDPTTANPNEGRGSFTFSTAGTFPAVDVPPLAADPTQKPFPRAAEPSNMAGTLVRNPRDGLVTVMAYLRGEEKFYDDNNNGIRDPGERFIDQGEAFVDSNDNGVWDPGETFIDDAPANGQWDGPNGVWDSDTTIWTETRILYTDRPQGGPAFTFTLPSLFAGPCPNGLPRGASSTYDGYFFDQNFNHPQADMTAFTISHVLSVGAPNLLNSGLLDGYGFGIDRRLIDPTTGGDCSPTTPICQWKTLFYDWKRPIVGVRFDNTRTTDTDPCQTDNVAVTASVLGVGDTVFTPGGVD